ncbi:uncharacterized protein HMPREF1541_09940 [Cyphellophora europaea CBS 101466]|uniref:Uncharacterized protein n=1 Tax=Cyphellophora europaea (strain CBS 101466) TaxID=1220924 RepID=W2SAX4_CYPE1|nr:uncharacterized protein HMPREF1541_09940 [Cyphellophora europaea CBS 101466]ETN45064.1 hypothetical protein HMPREF1541_09940 [Cyphellophora europaea CBS 101466]
MADDTSYMSFLNKANAYEPKSAVQETTSTSQGRSKFDPTSTGSASAAPKAIAELLSSTQPHYTSETDAPFEPFFAPYSGKSLPSAADFVKSLGTTGSSDIEELTADDFNPKGQYSNVIDAVKASGDGNIKVYRLEVSSTRAVYFIVTLAEGESKLVGLKVESVES